MKWNDWINKVRIVSGSVRRVYKQRKLCFILNDNINDRYCCILHVHCLLTFTSSSIFIVYKFFFIRFLRCTPELKKARQCQRWMVDFSQFICSCVLKGASSLKIRSCIAFRFHFNNCNVCCRRADHYFQFMLDARNLEGFWGWENENDAQKIREMKCILVLIVCRFAFGFVSSFEF